MDLAGPLWPHPTPLQIQARVNILVDRYLSVEHLCDRLNDLPHQFNHPTARSWPTIDWKKISLTHVMGIAPETFLRILVGIINTELPIRGYSQTSRQYLTSIHPGLAHFVGGQVNDQGGLVEKGLWEQEEQRHGPALIKVYRQLGGAEPIIEPHVPRAYHPSNHPYDDLYRHGLHRVATEYSATCLYLWLMAHSTGPLQQVFSELAKDEINHMTKFWGFGVWLFPEENRGEMVRRVIRTQLLRVCPGPWHLSPDMETNDNDRRFMPRMLHTLQRMRNELAWSHWSWFHRLEFVYTFLRVMSRLKTWNQTLTSDTLCQLFGPTPSTQCCGGIQPR
ncbi:MAG: ferritin-like domain-containing protein [Merismopedia sp. SIO2A8]|nr:ferritin-like domain-containing protein [Merismopedia sp. SIO2A8]